MPSELLQYLQIVRIARDPGQPLEEPGRGCHVKYTVKYIQSNMTITKFKISLQKNSYIKFTIYTMWL